MQFLVLLVLLAIFLPSPSSTPLLLFLQSPPPHPFPQLGYINNFGKELSASQTITKPSETDGEGFLSTPKKLIAKSLKKASPTKNHDPIPTQNSFSKLPEETMIINEESSTPPVKMPSFFGPA
ncbi:hypothetical protein CDAR_513131 [Caerostris darwini]|uniref:Uncharacterized protein n=1 Tax=Caerostris darwini TaxID=1538125 RepID=A0AAV4W3Q1_9ARAC|nr:hypothetical protein CDAR_513131 [Caerostris darwini]